MKKTLCFIMALVVTAIIAMPQTTRALSPDYNLPADAIGVNEEVYNELVNATCSYDGCGEEVERFVGKVIFRAEHHGEMYRVNSGDGTALLTRYLPDGFYRAKKKLYYVYNGTRYRVKKKNAYTRIINLINNNQIFTPISNEYYTQLTSNTASDNLMGKLVMEVEHHGEVHYICPLVGSEWPYTMKALDDFAPKKNKTFYTWMKKHAYKVSPRLMKKVSII